MVMYIRLLFEKDTNILSMKHVFFHQYQRHISNKLQSFVYKKKCSTVSQGVSFQLSSLKRPRRKMTFHLLLLQLLMACQNASSYLFLEELQLCLQSEIPISVRQMGVVNNKPFCPLLFYFFNFAHWLRVSCLPAVLLYRLHFVISFQMYECPQTKM